jgi:protein Mpv17
MNLEFIDEFFMTQPFLAAFTVCSMKASAADFLAQHSSSTATTATQTKQEKKKKKQQQQGQHTNSNVDINQFNINRNIAFWLYGGLYQGMWLQFLYTVVYPMLFASFDNSLVYQVHTEIVLFGPFLTLPLAYVIRSVIDNQSSRSGDYSFDDKNHKKLSSSETTITQQATQGLEKYKDHVMSQGLLFKYWLIWGPAQTINFTVVPPHMRVLFVAFVSFFWVYLLSMISSQGITATETKKETTNNHRSILKTPITPFLEELQERFTGLEQFNNLEREIRSV